MSYLQTVIDNLADDLFVIVLISFITYIHIGPVQLLTQISAVSVAHEGHITRSGKVEEPTTLPFALGSQGRSLSCAFWQTRQLLLVCDQQLEAILIF